MFTDLLDLVLPRGCVGCGRPAAGLCTACAGPPGRVVVDRPALPIRAGAVYDAGARQAVLAFKERGRRDLAGPLGALLARAVAALPPVPGHRRVLVCVPSSRAAIRARDGDHVLRLARVASRQTGVPVRRGVLRPARAKADSAGLGTAARARNLAGAFAARAPDGPALAAVLVDDVVTTGATLAEAARALQAAGWMLGGAAVCAATPRRRPGNAQPAPTQPSGSIRGRGLA